MREIVVAAGYSFQLSEKALGVYNRLSSSRTSWGNVCEIPRDDANLVKVVKELGKEAFYTEFTLTGDEIAEDTRTLKEIQDDPESYVTHALRIIEIPDDVKWEVVDGNDGEYVVEQHRVWRHQDDRSL